MFGATRDASQTPSIPFTHELWLDRGACRPYPTAWWFSTDLRESEAAKHICADCPVHGDCLEYALARPPLLGLWAGTKPAERAAIRSARIARRPAY